MSFIPVELVIQIIEGTYHNSDSTTDLKTLGSCALVCKAWSPIAKRLTFHHIHVDRKRLPASGDDDCTRVSALIRCMTTRPSLGSYVRMLEISVGRDRLFTTLPRRLVTFSDFVTLISYCPQLYQLILSVEHRQLQAPALSVLSKTATRLQALDIDTSDAYRDLSCILYQLMSIWPTIRFLRVRAGLSVPPPPTPRPPFTLHELHLFTPIAPEALGWLLPLSSAAAQSPLRVLGLGAPFAQLQSDELTTLAAQARSVRSLRITREPAPRFLDLFGAVEELVLCQLLLFPRIPALPTSVRHLGLYSHPVSYASDLDAELCAAADALKTLPNLENVTVNSTIAEVYASRALRLRCRELGVRFVVDPRDRYDRPVSVPRVAICPQVRVSERLILPLPKLEYLVPVVNPPRLLNAENLLRMNS